MATCGVRDLIGWTRLRHASLITDILDFRNKRIHVCALSLRTVSVIVSIKVLRTQELSGHASHQGMALGSNVVTDRLDLQTEQVCVSVPSVRSVEGTCVTRAEEFEALYS